MSELYDHDAEKAILSVVLCDPSQVDAVADRIDITDFHDPDLGQLWDALLAIHRIGFPLNDPKVVMPELVTLGVPEGVRNFKFLAGLIVNGNVFSPHSVYYADIVRKWSLLRRQHKVATQMLDRVEAIGASPEGVVTWLDGQMAGITDGHQHGARDAAAISAEVIEGLRNIPERQGRGAYTGIATFDQSVGGWHNGELIVLAARPGNGKTAFAAQVAMHTAKQGRPILFVSLEMKDTELLTRYLCGEAGVDSRRLRTGEYSPEDVEAMETIGRELDDVPFHVFDQPRASVRKIKALAKRQAAECGLSLLVVDYVERVTPEDRRVDKRIQIGQITVDLRSLGKEIGCPVLLLAQLKRDADKGVPTLSMLKESGDLEQEADSVVFLHHAGSPDEDGDSIVDCMVPKNRHGERGTIQLRFIGRRTCFTDQIHKFQF